ncbi:radical SAM family heme chaperone HemW [Bacillus alveayuensis]|jgi:oxygen-independent coproporphyrinogen-3 oxidase|uniref:radical SAM family heme chaperone HemW n=1 Tax=Aeribacillus alveayuensis TaxID=279215 RepID=UPI0005CD5BD9|nr:radical SAM family heme chaperone HemW [Bacillus alveayuensis]
MPKAVYIHIPFCEQICHYCDFNKFYIQYQPVDEYLTALYKEMQASFKRYSHNRIRTIFIGGGTPTALTAEQLDHLMNWIHELLDMRHIEEFTVEANPDNLTADKLSVLKNAHVNRLSIGVQTFQEDLLKKIGRTHTNEVVFKALKRAKKYGFDNLSIDLIYGLPGQSIEDFKKTLETALSLDLQHYSSYSLILEPKTVFYNLWRKGKLTLPPQEEEAAMYEMLMEKMEQKGFHQYEISNFACKGYESKHNLTYWNNEEYFGFGAGAHSYVNGVRRANIGPLKKYITSIERSGYAYLEEHEVTLAEKMEEQLFLGLRKTEGVSFNMFEQKFAKPLYSVFGEQIEAQKKKGLLFEKDGYIFLTHKGKLLGNEVFQAFLSVLNN